MIPDAPIFVAWYAFATWALDRAESFPKSSRFTYGQRLVNLCLEFEEVLVDALYSREKQGKLQFLNRRLSVMRIMIRRCTDRRMLSQKQYQHAGREIERIGRMLGGWIKQQSR
ncbi:MAG: diversity-generating retroelement protein Avd [Planctomycetota bacterium]|jgi:hypothetical protein|nr:diversity-generating retroelement protein Avd [Planctomycetota bacterium]